MGYLRCHFLFFAIIIIGCYSCNDKKTEQILIQADMLMQEHPDSSLTLLESITDPDRLNERQNALYSLAMVRALDKNYKDISGYKAIFQARDYFEKKKLQPQLSWSELYSGKVYHSRRDYENALLSFLQAETHAQNLPGEYMLKGFITFFIATTYFDQLHAEEAIRKSKEAVKHFSKMADNRHYEVTSYNLLANSYLLDQQRDSAISTYNRGLKLANEQSLLNQRVEIEKNLALAYLKMDSVSNAKNSLMRLVGEIGDTTLISSIYIILSKAYEAENQLDSAFYFANRSLDLVNKDHFTSLGSRYRTLSRLEEKRGDYNNALQYHKQYTKVYTKFQEEKRNNSIRELQKRYDYELLKGNNNLLLIQRQGIAIIALTLLVLLIFFLFLFYSKNIRNRNEIAQAREVIFELKEMVHKTGDSIHPILVEHFDLVKKLSLLEGYLREDEREQGREIIRRLNLIVYEQDMFDWEKLYQPMNKLYNGYFDLIREKLPELNETEFRICCLSVAKLNTTEISILLKLKPNTIHIRKTRIRKKLGLPSYEDLPKAIESIIDRR